MWEVITNPVKVTSQNTLLKLMRLEAINLGAGSFCLHSLKRTSVLESCLPGSSPRHIIDIIVL